MLRWLRWERRWQHGWLVVGMGQQAAWRRATTPWEAWMPGVLGRARCSGAGFADEEPRGDGSLELWRFLLELWDRLDRCRLEWWPAEDGGVPRWAPRLLVRVSEFVSV